MSQPTRISRNEWKIGEVLSSKSKSLILWSISSRFATTRIDLVRDFETDPPMPVLIDELIKDGFIFDRGRYLVLSGDGWEIVEQLTESEDVRRVRDSRPATLLKIWACLIGTFASIAPSLHLFFERIVLQRPASLISKIPPAELIRVQYGAWTMAASLYVIIASRWGCDPLLRNCANGAILGYAVCRLSPAGLAEAGTPLRFVIWVIAGGMAFSILFLRRNKVLLIDAGRLLFMGMAFRLAEIWALRAPDAEWVHGPLFLLGLIVIGKIGADQLRHSDVVVEGNVLSKMTNGFLLAAALWGGAWIVSYMEPHLVRPGPVGGGLSAFIAGVFVSDWLREMWQIRGDPPASRVITWSGICVGIVIGAFVGITA